MKKYKKGLLSLSGDPVTWGHLDLVRRAAKQCDHLLVAILNNPGKNGYVFSEEERAEHMKKAIEDFCPGANTSVISSEDSMLDVFLTQGCDVIFRGARDKQDREYEDQQIFYHEMVIPGIRKRTVILSANPKLKHVQSTVARNFAVEHLDASKLVPMFIQARLWRRIHKQKVIGITGPPGVGKSTLIEATLKSLRENNLPAHHISMDELSEMALGLDTPGSRGVQQVKSEGLSQWPSSTYLAHVQLQYRKWMKGRGGIILFEATELAEMNLFHWVNNNVIVVTRPGFGSSAKKLEACKKQAEKDKYGLTFEFTHEEGNFSRGLGGVLVANIRNGRM